MRSAGFNGSYDEFKQFFAPTPVLLHRRGALLSAYRDIAKRADPQLAHLFGRLPQTPYGVKAVPDASAPSQTTAYYDRGSFAAGRPGDMFANTYKLDSRPKMGDGGAHAARGGARPSSADLARAGTGRACPSSARTRATPRSSKGGASTRVARRAKWGSTGSVSKFGRLTYEMWRAVPARRRHRPALDGLDAQAGHRLSSAPTPPKPTRTSSSKSIATSSGPARRSVTRWAS